jgi:hypothetical protein
MLRLLRKVVLVLQRLLQKLLMKLELLLRLKGMRGQMQLMHRLL